MEGNNFHMVTYGRVYRSAQMNGKELSCTIREFGIKTILNLRGENADSSWYRAETNTASQLQVKHLDIALSAGRELSDEEMDQILAILRTSEKPLLVHCSGGADRTGLVCALYRFAIEEKTTEDAAMELSIRYGHFPYLFWSDSKAMDKSFRRFTSNKVVRANEKIPCNPVLSESSGQFSLNFR